jgi:hypothetical protein
MIVSPSRKWLDLFTGLLPQRNRTDWYLFTTLTPDLFAGPLSQGFGPVNR